MAKDVEGLNQAIGSHASAEEPWQRFVLVHGAGALNRDLAVVLGRSASEIEDVKRALTGDGTRRRGKSFEDLFQLWHGRPPRDNEWPVPTLFARRGSYEWLAPEVAMVATLVGQMAADEIAQVLTTRLQAITGDATAKRDRMAVQNQISRMGLMSSDVLGGITVAAAGREVGSYALVHQAVRGGQLKARRVGRHLVVPHKAWSEWKSKIQGPPEGYVQLSTLKGPLGVRSDKLSEFARMNYVPGAVQVKPFGTKNVHTTQFGSWYIPQAVADQLVADRHAGRPMPWHGKPLLDNLKVTFLLWQERQHPKDCATCTQIWGEGGAPRDFEDYITRYPALDHGAKRHLTMVWTPGLTIAEAARHASRTEPHVRRAIANGMLATRKVGRVTYISRTDVSRWMARRCPTGDAEKSWISIETATKQYHFTATELQDFCDRGLLNSKVGTDGAMRGIRYVARHQCGQLREQLGFTEEQAAARIGVTVPQLRELLTGVNWRGAEGIPLVTIQAVIKRIQSQEGISIEDTALALRTTEEWVRARISDGTVTVSRTSWDQQRLYFTRPMFERLRASRTQPLPKAKLGPEWLRLSDAAALAGVSTTSLIQWCEEGSVRREVEGAHHRYHQDDVRAQARLYWRTVRFKRKQAPEWLRAEQQAAHAGDRAGTGDLAA